MTVVEVRAGTATIAFTATKTLFETAAFGLEGQMRNFDIAPDGSRLLMVRNLPPPADVPALVLVQNWLGELGAAVR